MSLQGTVKFFNVQKGFGFISPSDGGADLFVHATDVRGNSLMEGDEVYYDSEYDDRKGKERAANVTGGTGSADAGKGGGFGKGGGKDFGGKGKGKKGGFGFEDRGMDKGKGKGKYGDRSRSRDRGGYY